MSCVKYSKARGGHYIYSESHMLLKITATNIIYLACLLITSVIRKSIYITNFYSKVQRIIISQQDLGPPVSSNKIEVSRKLKQLSLRVYQKVELSRESTLILQRYQDSPLLQYQPQVNIPQKPQPIVDDFQTCTNVAGDP